MHKNGKLQNGSGEKQNLTILQVRFDSFNQAPLITYQLGEEPLRFRRRVFDVVKPAQIADLHQTLIVLLTPCPICADHIRKAGVERVIIGRFSKYPIYENYCRVDQDDLTSLNMMDQAGIQIMHTPGTRKPIMFPN